MLLLLLFESLPSLSEVLCGKPLSLLCLSISLLSLTECQLLTREKKECGRQGVKDERLWKTGGLQCETVEDRGLTCEIVEDRGLNKRKRL